MAGSTGELRVRDVMSKDVVSISPNDTIHDALDLIVENRVSALPVVDGRNRCVGVLSTSDIVDITHEVDDEFHNLGRHGDDGRPWLFERLGELLGAEPVSQQMSESVATTGPDTLLGEAASRLLCNRVHRLPVVDAQGRLLGILSTTDIVAAVADGLLARAGASDCQPTAARR